MARLIAVCPPAPLTSHLEQNLIAVRGRLDRAVQAAGRAPGEVQLLPVTKSVDAPLAAQLYALGATELAENRVDRLEHKAAALAHLNVHWHFVGHLQRNKARRVLQRASVLHSVDSLRLVEALSRISAEEGRRPSIYLQVNLTGESEKHGMLPAELGEALLAAAQSPSLVVLGLMAMGPLGPTPGEPADHDPTTRVFERVQDLARSLELEQARSFSDGRCRLSMGMSGDLERAVAAGSTLVRVGTALFSGVADPASNSAEGQR